MIARLRVLGLHLVVPVGALLAFWAWSERADSFFFPPASEIARFFADLWLFDRVPGDLLPSLGRMFAGYAIAVAAGVAAGTALGLSRTLRTAADPVVQFLRALPPPALIPFALLLFGAGDASKVFIIALGTVWPILLNTIDGVRGVERGQLDAARSYQVPVRARLTRIILPAASPRIVAGMRTSLSIAIILMVVSEMVASDNGVGYFVLESQRSFAIPEMWTGIVLLGLLGFLLNWLFQLVEARVLFWHRGLKGTNDDA
ncbi:ABC transporter permease [Actinomadura miaoliensis]|uniref:ABC transporter permease n=1 Tax=Actinomadura miaoliensis TaxID=430685 RepID=A0ABP7WFP2_9ACTN